MNTKHQTDRDYIATVEAVQEIGIRGKSRWQFWKDYLASSDLILRTDDQHARVSYTVSAIRWKGFSFLESTLVVEIENPDREGDVAAYLVAALSTSRLLAFCERTMFRTPYYRGEATFNIESPQRFTVSHRDGSIINASRSSAAESAREEDEWEGPVYFSGNRGRRSFMNVRLAGDIEVYPFRNDVDCWEVESTSDDQIAGLLSRSGFQPTQWRLRTDGTHSRSKTYDVRG